jgi:signal transduction histidine kinase
MTRLGLVGKLAFISGCILFALGIAVTWYSLSQLREIVYDQSFRRVEAQALNWIEANTAQLALTRNQPVIERLVRELAQRQGIAYVSIVDSSGATLAVASVPEGLRHVRQKFAATPKATVAETVSSRGDHFFEFQVAIKPTGMSRDLDTMFGLAAGPAAPASLRLGIARSDLDDQVTALLWRNAPLYTTLVLLALLIQTTFARGLVRPIVGIGQVAQRIAAGDLSKRVEQGAELNNEVGALVRNFNDMAQRIDELHSRLEQKVSERTHELEAANAKLEELNRVKSQFLSTVSHEFRTPLTSIKAFAQILLDSPIEDQHTRQRFLNIIDTETDRLTRLISDLLDLAKIEAGVVLWRNELFDIADLLQQCCAAMTPVAVESKISLDCETPRGLRVQGDTDRFLQVVTNLIGNALKFCPAGTRVHVSAESATSSGPSQNVPGRYVLVSVTDSGPGIQASDCGKVFDRFFRGSSGGHGAKGTGLGLAICREIVQHHGGEIWVDSVAGDGSTFRFTVPLALKRANAASNSVEEGTRA